MRKLFKSKFRSSFKGALIWDDLLTETKEKTPEWYLLSAISEWSITEYEETYLTLKTLGILLKY